MMRRMRMEPDSQTRMSLMQSKTANVLGCNRPRELMASDIYSVHISTPRTKNAANTDQQ